MPKYFSDSEFKKVGCSMSDMSPTLLEMLDAMRHFYGQPIHLNSAFRTVAHELAHGRTGTSSHCKGLAVDLLCPIDKRYHMLNAAINAGFRRIGIGSTFLHVDIDDSKPMDCIWTY